MIIYHFHIHPQFIYESFHIHYLETSCMSNNVSSFATALRGKNELVPRCHEFLYISRGVLRNFQRTSHHVYVYIGVHPSLPPPPPPKKKQTNKQTNRTTCTSNSSYNLVLLTLYQCCSPSSYNYHLRLALEVFNLDSDCLRCKAVHLSVKRQNYFASSS